MENSTPLTRCDTCHTVFEVPSSILESADSRVRCGECLQVFDASINLHTASRPDFSLVDDTLVEGTEASANKSAVTVTNASAPHRDLETETSGTYEQSRAAAGSSKTATPDITAPYSADEARLDRPSDGIVSGRMHGSDRARLDDTADESHLEATMSDFDLFSDDASLPEVSYEFDENTIDAIRLQFDSVDDVADETLSDSLFPNEVTIDASGLNVSSNDKAVAVGGAVDLSASQARSKVGAGDKPASEVDDVIKRSVKTDFVVEEGPRPETVEFDFSEKATGEELPANTSSVTTAAAITGAATAAVAGAAIAGNTVANAMTGDAAQTLANTDHAAAAVSDTVVTSRRPSRIGRHLFHASLVLLTLVLIAALYGYRERNNLVDNPLTRPFYIVWCSVKGCAVPARFDKSQLKVVEKNIFSHPTLDDALVITVLLENSADFEQRYPALFLWLSDSARRTVASNEFEPSVYLPENGLTAESVLAPGQQRKISIDVRDPGRRAVSLELSLR